MNPLLSFLFVALGTGAAPPSAGPKAESFPYRITYTGEALRDPSREMVITHSHLLKQGQVRDLAEVRLKAVNADGQAQGVEGWVTRASVTSGAGRNQVNGLIRPPGWEDGKGYTRLMLFPTRLGGNGQITQNLVTVHRAGVVPKFSAVMGRIRDAAVKDGKKVEFQVTPVYTDKGKPASLVIKANVPLEGDKREVTIENKAPAGKAPEPVEKGLLPEVARLKRLMPPPTSPKATGSDGQWKAVEKRLKLTFPEDYRQFIRLYGEGEVNGFFRVNNPHSGGPANFEAEVSGRLAAWREVKKSNPKQVPYELWPAPGGLLPLGSTIDGDELFWKTKGEPRDWTIVVFLRGDHAFTEENCNWATFLRRVFDEEVQLWLPKNGRPKFVQPGERE